MKHRYRPRMYITLDEAAIRLLQRMVAAGLYPNNSRAIEAAVKRLARQHERQGELPPDPGDEDDNSPA